MDNPILFPEPQSVHWPDGAALPLPTRIVLRANASVTEQLAAQRLADVVEERHQQQVQVQISHADEEASAAASGAPTFYLDVQTHLQHPEAYRIYDDGENIHLVGGDALGVSHAVETARQLLTTTEWFRCQIDDWPDYAHRGIYVECFWGTDLMELADWYAFIDYLVSLKFNTLNVGFYGCWEIKYNGEPTEFLMTPLRNYPQLQTPQTVRYIDPASAEWVERTYLPRTFEDDLWPQIFAYARERGVQIVPQFGGPAHNTLIPRVLPQVSARQADGSPTHYGYCVSSPETWTFLRTVVDELVERYCQPFDVRFFNIAGDEVYPIRNVLTADPSAEVSPWCACDQCRRMSEFEQLCAYLFGMAELLAEHGIRAVVWADSLDRMGQVAEFKEEAARRGLAEQIVLQWWCYKEPLPQLASAPEIETWVEPSPGLVGNLLYQEFSRNIYGFLQRGREAGATGVTAYNVPDFRLDKNYVCLAEFSWNAGAGSIPHFHIRYAQRTYGEAWRTALEAYDVAERIMGCYPLAVNVVDQLLHYFNNFPHGRVRYPDDLIAALAADPLALLGGLRLVEAHMQTAETLLSRVDTGGPIRTHFLLECQRYRGLVAALLGVLDSLRHISDARAAEHQSTAAEDAPLADVTKPLNRALGSANTAHSVLRNLMRSMAELQAPYLLPSALREYSALLDWISRLCTQLERARQTYQANPSQGVPALPLLEAINIDRLRIAWHPWEF